MPSRQLLPSLLLALSAAFGCSAAEERSAADSAAMPRTVVDSALPMEALLRRFRAELPDTPTVLSGGAKSPQSLVDQWARAVEASDTGMVRALVLSKAEYAWLYFPETRHTKPPYELPPAIHWTLLIGASEKGIARLLDRFGGAGGLKIDALLCPDSTRTEGANVLLEGCRVKATLRGEGTRTLSLFGPLIRRDGLWKFVSYANDF